MGISQIASTIRDPSQLLNQYGFIPAKIDNLSVDVMIVESPVHEWEPTRHPTTSGASVTDLRVDMPLRLSVTCFMGDKQYDIRSIVSNVITGEGLMPETWRDKYEAMRELWGKGEPIRVQTGLDVYDDMLIVNVSPIRNVETAGGFMFDIAFEQVTIISTSFFDIDTSLLPQGDEPSEDKKATDKKTSKKKNRKRTQTKEASQEEETSLAYDLFGGGA